MLRVISELQPTWVIGENVGGLVSMAQSDCEIKMETETAILKDFEMVLETIRRDFERIGYESQPILIPACAVGARHRRDRVFILGYSKHNGTSTSEDRRSIGAEHVSWGLEKSESQAAETCGKFKGTSSISKNVAYADSEGFQITGHESRIETVFTKDRIKHSSSDVANTNSKGVEGCKASGNIESIRQISKQYAIRCSGFNAREPNWKYWEFEPSVGRVVNGIPSRVDRLKCLGNAVVPQQAYPIFQAIADIENSTN
jgi:DNA (cytosine-5)-methyltransferase 1